MTIFDIGQKAGLLTIIAELPKGPKYQQRYLVRCDCGIEKAVRGGDLRPGHTISCGCHARQAAVTHGETRRGRRTAEWRCWIGIKQRCYDSNHRNFTNYGGRGIKICDRWRENYEQFLADMGRRPSAKHSIDRIDVNGNYEPGNCRWATSSEQRRNQRNSLA